MNNTTFTTHEQVVEYIWSIDKSQTNHVFHINSALYKQYSVYSNKHIPDYVTFCREYNLSLGYELHTNRHPVILNYYNSDSEYEEEDGDDTTTGETDDIEDDTAPLLKDSEYDYCLDM